MDKDQKIKIAGSLSEGEIYSTKIFALVYIGFALLLLCTCAVAAVSLIEDNVAYLFAALFPAVCTALLGYFVICDAVKRVRCYRCLKDGVRVKAFCEKVMATPPSYAKNINKYIKINVSFEYKGKVKNILSGKSGYEGKGSLEKAGFAAINARYANREVEVIYSPTYDEVLFLSEEK